MRESCLFSIIVPAFQVEHYLDDCLKSIVSQNYGACEIVLIDDGSTDRTSKICDYYQQKYSNVLVIHQENQGLSAARNSGLLAASGKYAVFADSDDMLCEHSLRQLEHCIENYKEPEVIISRRKTYAGAQMEECQYFFDKKLVEETDIVKIYNKLQSMKDCWLGAWIFCVRMDYLLKYHLFFCRGIYHEDEEWVPRILYHAKWIGFNNHTFYCNRVNRPGSITNSANIKREFDKLHIVDLLDRYFVMPLFTEEIVNAVACRRAKLVFGVLSGMDQYKDDIQYTDLLKGVMKNVRLLKQSSRMIHKSAYYLSLFAGIKKTAKLIKIMIGIR